MTGNKNKRLDLNHDQPLNVLVMLLCDKFCNDNHDKTLSEALEFYGESTQILKFVEESSELNVELLKFLNEDAANKPDIIEELADVLITVAHLLRMFCLVDEQSLKDLLSQIDFKMLRLKNRTRQ